MSDPTVAAPARVTPPADGPPPDADQRTGVLSGATWAVAGREIREALRSRAMRITLVVTVLAVIGLLVLFHFTSTSSRPEIDVAAPSELAAIDVDALGTAIGTDIRLVTVDSDEAARAAVTDGTADVAVLDGGRQLLTEHPLDPDATGALADTARVLQAQIGLTTALADAGLNPSEITAALNSPGAELVSVTTGDENDGRDTSAGISNVALFMMLQIYGAWVLNAVTTEKSNRVVEVLLAVVRPRQLMVGKIVGVGVVALGHAATIAAAALITSRILGADIANALPTSSLVSTLIWFVAGFALYSAAYAAAGSLVSRTEDAQGVSFPVGLPLLVGYLATFSVIGGANTFVWILAFFPPTAVLAMPAMYQAGIASLPAMLLSLAVTVVAIVVVVRIAAGIYERSILRTGKPVRWAEALRRSEPRPGTTAS